LFVIYYYLFFVFGNQGEIPATNVTLVLIPVAMGSFFSQIPPYYTLQARFLGHPMFQRVNK